MHQNKLLKKGRRNLIRLITFFLFLLFTTGCNKLVDVSAPSNSLTGPTIYSSDGTAASVTTGMLTQLAGGSFCIGTSGISMNAGLLADELQLFSTGAYAPMVASYGNKLTSVQVGTDFSVLAYPIIYMTNSAVENLTASKNLTPVIKEHLLGEAKFIRAFCYFYMTNLYGNVPLTTTSDYTKNALLANSTKEEIYNQIISDLKDAQGLLTDDYLGSDVRNVIPDRIRPNKGAATALLARAYLYKGDWANSEIQASALINDSTRYHLTDLNTAFLKTSPEAILQLQEVSFDYALTDTRTFIIPSTGPSGMNPFYLSSFQLNSFEPGDNRRIDWVDSTIVGGVTYNYPYKYKDNTPGSPLTEHAMVMRLAEQYLIRAEARAQMGNTVDAAKDIDAIRNRAGLPNTTASTVPDLLDAILRERRSELFTEWGHRWFDLKRTGNIDAVMSVVTPQKGGAAWVSTQQLIPYSYYQLSRDPNLKQNPGY